MLRVGKETKKVDILAVLEDGSQMSAREVLAALQKRGLNPTLNTLRVNLKRCCDRQFVQRVKVGSSFRYSITERGMRRLHSTRAQKNKEIVDEVRAVLDDEKSRTTMRIRAKDRALELVNSFRLARAARKLVAGSEESWLLPQMWLWSHELLRLLPRLDSLTLSLVAALLSKPFAETSRRQGRLLQLLLIRKLNAAEAFAFHLMQKQRREDKPTQRWERTARLLDPLPTPKRAPEASRFWPFVLGITVGGYLQAYAITAALTAAVKKKLQVEADRRRDKQLVDRYLTMRFLDWWLARRRTPPAASTALQRAGDRALTTRFAKLIFAFVGKLFGLWNSAPSTQATATTDPANDLDRWWQGLRERPRPTYAVPTFR